MSAAPTAGTFGAALVAGRARLRLAVAAGLRARPARARGARRSPGSGSRPRAALVREPGPARVVEGDAFRLRIRAEGRRVPLPGGELTDPVLDEPVAVGPRWDGASTARSGSRGAAAGGSSRPGSSSATRSGSARASSSPTARASCSSCRGSIRCSFGRPRSGRLQPARRARGRERGRTARRARDRARDRRPARVSRGQPGVAHPLARRRANRRADRAPAGRGRRHRAAGRPRRGRARPRRRRSTPPCAPPARSAGTSPASGGCAILLPGDRRATPVEARAARLGRRRTPAWRWSSRPPRRPRSLACNARARSSGSPRGRARVLPSVLRLASGPRYLVGPGVSGRGSPALLVSGCEGRRVGARSTKPLERVA